MVKKFAIGILLLLTALAWYWGAYRPLVKARLYVAAVSAAGRTNLTLETFEKIFTPPLTYASFVGDEEVFKYFANDVTMALESTANSEAVSRELVDFLEPHVQENDVMHLLSMVNVYNIMWYNFKRDEYFAKAESYYRKALALGPKLPPTLYGLLELYRSHGDIAKAKEIAGTILRYWPGDEEVQKFLKG